MAKPPASEKVPVDDGHLQVRVWLRMLGSANVVLGQLRRALREEFDITMPAFDLLAQVHRPPQGPTMGQLSQRLMVSKGNVSDLVERLETKGLILRRIDDEDGRVQHVHLTPEGEALVERMLPAHRAWLKDMMTGLDEESLVQLYQLIGAFKTTLVANTTRKPGKPRLPKKSSKENDR
jgi:DNA-binding MarR family transcriptional regulator